MALKKIVHIGIYEYPCYSDVTTQKLSEERVICAQTNGTLLSILDKANPNYTEFARESAKGVEILYPHLDSICLGPGNLKYEKSRPVLDKEVLDHIADEMVGIFHHRIGVRVKLKKIVLYNYKR